MRTAPRKVESVEGTNEYRFMKEAWPAKWVGPEGFDASGVGVWAYRNRIQLDSPQRVQIDVSADQRYQLFLDGQPIGRGPERGDLRHWMYETYDLELSAGSHTLVAIAWWLSPTCPTPPAEAQVTVRPGFWMMCESVPSLQTGVGPWEVKPVDGLSFTRGDRTRTYYAVDPRLVVDGRAYPWGVEQGQGDGWRPAPVVQTSAAASLVWESHPYWLLRPAMLPAMRQRPVTTMAVRYVAPVEGLETLEVPVDPDRSLPDEVTAWSALLNDNKPLTIPPHTGRRVLIDFQTYLCAFTQLRTRGGAGATVLVKWAESLYMSPGPVLSAPAGSVTKGNRDEIAGRYFIGHGDSFTTDGQAGRSFGSFWWNSGRYIEVVVQTQGQPLTVDALAFEETGYPYEFEPTFESDDPRLAPVMPLGLRTLQMCSHETSMDCPYYEQLNYAGDTRLQSLVAMTASRDDRLVRKSIQLFDWSRTGDNWASSRYPTRILQTIPTFNLFWAGMVYDYALYRGDREFILGAMPGVRSVLERWRRQIDAQGLVRLPAGWNFMDWNPGWKSGMSNPERGSACGIMQWLLAYALQQAGDLEQMLGEPLLAQRNHQTAAALAAVGEQVFFDAQRGIFADDPEKTRFSEHAQVMALLSGHLSANLRPRVAQGLIEDRTLTPTSLYFSHYTFEAMKQLGRTNELIRRLEPWFAHGAQGLHTLIEHHEPTRSDCHAWGAHPVYHYFATILGIRPGGWGFESVVVAPQLGPLSRASGKMVHPKGEIAVDLTRTNGGVTGSIRVPDGVPCRVELGGQVNTFVGGMYQLG